ncbi:DUF5683 domain-containing protein [Flagellimonas zhangzhouensis]|uniref:DUF5683 domain-containing protein n=1 Tax=Flagellimonas zhangzhouensis TaxID=1073328 RepID=A0A1H2R7Y6_9FLAO|nr:DUF5683 domain-containing protein [Allomuricauda zhangzhouensis]SDQ59983.1 hypothetical protein SAMN05216294_1846 [Allomuricauda zhangzhouensis]SDW14789.1 hypothetical protein SAMN04487892_0498 [Allomuricauda zhangzhouensis]
MTKNLFFLFFFILFLQSGFSQEEKEGEPTEVPQAKEIEPTQQIQGEGVTFEEVSKKQNINPLAPSKAAFYSAVLPGLGQIYNRRYWKAPIVWGALGTGIYVYSYNNTEYRRARNAFKRRLAGFSDDEFYDINGDGSGPDISDEALQEAQENTQRDRDLALVITIALYALNIIDANVDSHLQQYNVDDNLALDFQPFIDINPFTNQPNYGMALVVKF